MCWLPFGLLLVLTAHTAEGNPVTVTTNSYTKVTISRPAEGPNCTVCSSQTCATKQVIALSQTTQVNFTCSRPQDIFTIEINRDFDCSKTCSYDSIQADWSTFQDFNRIFTWDMKVEASKSFQLEFPASGMRQIQSSEECADKQVYSLLMYSRDGPVNLGKFCQNGTITRMQVVWKGRLTLEVGKGTTPSSFAIKYSEAVDSAVAIDAVLPRGLSSTDFLSASGIPKDYTVKWNFVLPLKHNFTVDFVKYIQPECQSKQVKVIYQQTNMAAVEKPVTDPQPTNYQGNFSLSLRNCDAKSGATLKLFLHFSVSVFRSGFPDLCMVDLQSAEGLSLQIEKKNQDNFCEMGVNAVVQEKIVVPAGSKANLTFLDCPKDNLLLTATKTIGCMSLSSCPIAGTLLTIPVLDSCLSPSLSQVRWVLNVPEQGSVELSSPQGSLYQSVPGVQECDGLLSALVSAADGADLGRFCSVSKGIIQKVQISSNITVTASADGDKDLRQEKAPILNVSFSSEVTDTFIYTVSPLISTPAFLMTPNWPGAMKPDSTMSWIVNVPEEYGAQLYFSNVSLPVCRNNHAEIKIQEQGSTVETGFREDKQLVLEHNMLRSFSLNMSNCEPEEGKFAILSKISLQKKPGNLINIILGVVGALLVLLVILLTVVCLLVRKKKRKSNRSSICIPKGVASLPGDATFPKTRADNESHVYTSIDETMMYGHLLQQDGSGPGHFNGHQVDGYHAFTGPMDKTIKDPGFEQNVERGPDKDSFRAFLPPSESFIPRPHTPLRHLDSLDYEDRRMVDKVLYTFKAPGEANPIRLSAVEPELLPKPEPEDFSEPEQFDQEYDEAM
ncbi:CUB domain-containing protein 1 [Tachysurus fulvidraco]|uniref:CUB domain-containing protein 1 n=1 Tax=Tachysurus fulvidraco TaxID=1234273 RepID=UPI000F5087D1|nr:CUB domain-containing protein 1 [Tachysurus fulvidraco]